MRQRARDNARQGRVPIRQRAFLSGNQPKPDWHKIKFDDVVRLAKVHCAEA